MEQNFQLLSQRMDKSMCRFNTWASKNIIEELNFQLFFILKKFSNNIEIIVNLFQGV